MFTAVRSGLFRWQAMRAQQRRLPAAIIEPIERRILLASVSGAVYHDLDADGTRDTGEAGLPGWTVFLDANGNGAFDAAVANSSVSSTDTPRNILDGGTTVSSLSVSGLVGSITDLNIRLYITHTWDADLEVSLIGPDGTRVTLFAAVGGSGDNFGSPTTPTTLDDEAVVSINAGSAPFAGQYRPSGALAGFDGLDPNGNWSLQIVDVTTPDAGILQSWSLDFTLGEPSRVSDAAGNYQFANLPAGEYAVRQIVQTNWQQTSPPAGAAHVLTLLADDQLNGIDFGNAPLPGQISGTVFNDYNGNGVRDAGEPGLSGWSVFLDLNGNRLLDQNEPSATTDASGLYTIGNIAPGDYRVAQVVFPGWQQTYPGSGGTIGGAPAALGARFVSSIPVRHNAVPQRRPVPRQVFADAVDQAADLHHYTARQIRAVRNWVIGLPKRARSLAALKSLAKSIGAVEAMPVRVVQDVYVLSFSSRRSGTAIAHRLGAAQPAAVSFFYPLIPRLKPNRYLPNDPMFSLQWHLRNTGQSGGSPGSDANLAGAWDNYQGEGVAIGIVDDGLEYTHGDLLPNYVPALSYDYFSGDANPAPALSDIHGTAVAGVAAARGSNSLGVSGAAPRAALAGIRLTSGATNDAQEAAALTHLIDTIDVFNSSWGPSDDGHTLEAPGPLTRAAIQSGAVNGRGGRGVVYVWAAGNGKTANDNVNYDGYANSRYVIAVSAIDHNGVQASYSEPGAPILVAAYSSGAGAGITTTDRVGSLGYSSSDYTSSFGGTSAAAPLVSGIVALMLQANPELTWRDVQHILARTARKNDPTDPGWTTNGAGLHINHKYGFGAVDADAAVNLARSWTNVGPEVFLTSGTLSVGQSIPDNNPAGLTRSFEVSSAINVEAVEVVVNITHTNRGQLRIVLVSPMGTESVLADVHNDNGDHYSNWTFTTKRNWNEISRGTWTLKVVDAANGTVGTLNDWKLNIYGTQADEFVHYVRVQANSSLTSRDFGDHETIAPSVAASLFEFESAQRFSITFDEEMAAGSIEASDLLLENLTTATTLPSASISVSYDPSTRTATFTFTGFAGGILPDGNYRATLNAGTVSDLSGNTLASASISSFFVLGGDANRDRVVDIRDLSILAGNWGQSPRTFSQADFNYDGKVDTADLDILSANWQKVLE